jgi:RHS repeat-associated protein
VWSLAPGNQLKATGRAKYVNDGRGRRIQRIERADGKDLREHAPHGDERVTTYGWDSKDRLREVVTPEGLRVRFAYDAFGRRVRKEVLPKTGELSSIFREQPAATSPTDRKTVHFLWDGDVLCEEQDASKEERWRKRVHVHVPGGFAPMLQVERGEVFGVINDHLGMPKELVDSSGQVAWRATHGAWGGVLEASRDPGAAEVASPFRLLGQYADEETGLCSTRFRYFEPETGRWLSPDPLGVVGGWNLLGWTQAPVHQSDPLGLQCVQGHHGADGDKILYMIANGRMVSDANGEIFLSVQQGDTFVHGADSSRRAAFSVQVEVTVPPGGRVEHTSRPGNPQTIIVHTPEPHQPVEVTVSSMTARTRTYDPEEGHTVTTITTYTTPAAIQNAL